MCHERGQHAGSQAKWWSGIHPPIPVSKLSEYAVAIDNAWLSPLDPCASTMRGTLMAATLSNDIECLLGAISWLGISIGWGCCASYQSTGGAQFRGRHEDWACVERP